MANRRFSVFVQKGAIAGAVSFAALGLAGAPALASTTVTSEPAYISQSGDLLGNAASDYTVIGAGTMKVVITTEFTFDPANSVSVNGPVNFTFTTTGGHSFTEQGTEAYSTIWYLNASPSQHGYEIVFDVPVPHTGSNTYKNVSLSFGRFTFSTPNGTYQAYQPSDASYFEKVYAGAFGQSNIIQINPGGIPDQLPEVPYTGLMPVVGLAGIGLVAYARRRRRHGKLLPQ